MVTTSLLERKDDMSSRLSGSLSEMQRRRSDKYSGALQQASSRNLIGRKALLYTTVGLSLGSSFALVVAPNLLVLFVSKLLLGLSTVTTPLYVTSSSDSSCLLSLAEI